MNKDDMHHCDKCQQPCCSKYNYADWTCDQINKAKKELTQRRLEIKALMRPLLEEETSLNIMEREYNRLMNFLED